MFNNKILKAFLSGTAISITEVEDEVFSSKCMGDGIAIIPNDNILYAPFDGVVIVTMDKTKHGCVMRLDNNMEILLHIGINTVNMNGDGFEYLVNKNDHVKLGQPLIKFDIDKIKNAGLKTDTIMVIMNDHNKKVKFLHGHDVIACETEISM